MTNEEKQLLLKDLCARLPYGVNVLDDTGRVYKLQLGNAYLIDLFYGNGDYMEAPIRPYLRPMSSMTEKEYDKYEQTFDNVMVYSGHNNSNIHSEHRPSYETFDYLNSIHVDYRGLIEEGLALEAPEDMYNN